MSKASFLGKIRAAATLGELAAVEARIHRARERHSESERQSIAYAVEARREELKAAEAAQRLAGEDVCQECGEVMDDAAIERDEDADFCTQCQRRGDDDRFEREWQREQAIEAGMMGGCDAYNEVMGWD